jgi:NADH dehydrogenase [ubiquinone] 1 alpha subcomplex assembly factor 5
MCIDTRDISNLLGRAGFTLVTVDVDEVKVAYPSMWELTEDLRDMGESNAIIGRQASHGPKLIYD